MPGTDTGEAADRRLDVTGALDEALSAVWTLVLGSVFPDVFAVVFADLGAAVLTGDFAAVFATAERDTGGLAATALALPADVEDFAFF